MSKRRTNRGDKAPALSASPARAPVSKRVQLPRKQLRAGSAVDTNSVADQPAFAAGVIQVASAGTGKTFALSSRYLRLLLEGTEPASILATTFTRAAAGEILDRIVQRLAVAACGEEPAAELAKQLGLFVDRSTALAALARLMRSLHQLQVGTIDSFFHGVARAVTLELGLPPDWALFDPDQTVAGIDLAVQDVLAGGKTGPLLNLLTQTNANRRISAAFHDLVAELYSLWQEALPSAWKVDLPAGEIPDAVRREAWLATLEAEAAAGGAQLAKALRRDIEALTIEDWEQLAESTLIGNVLRGECKYYKRDFSAQLVDVLRGIGDAVSVALIRMLRQRNDTTAGLLRAFAEKYQAWQRENGSLGFDDLGRLLRPLARAGAGPLQSRLRHEVRHLLLDEFQDTAPGQWEVLEPLAREEPDLSSL